MKTATKTKLPALKLFEGDTKTETAKPPKPKTVKQRHANFDFRKQSLIEVVTKGDVCEVIVYGSMNRSVCLTLTREQCDQLRDQLPA